MLVTVNLDKRDQNFRYCADAKLERIQTFFSDREGASDQFEIWPPFGMYF